MSLMGEDWLGGEWDPERQLILPRSRGPAAPGACAAWSPGCPSDGHWTSSLCVRHRGQFERSDERDLEAWLASGEPRCSRRRWVADQACVVSGADGEGCPRPAQGRWRLCQRHGVNWRKQRGQGRLLRGVPGRGGPLSEPRRLRGRLLLPAAAAQAESRLCEIHYEHLARPRAVPSGTAFSEWAARVRQPVNSRVLQPAGPARAGPPGAGLRASAAGLAEQVRTSSPAGCAARSTSSGPSGVASVLEFDLDLLDGIGDSGPRALRPLQRRPGPPGLCRSRALNEPSDVWDLRLFGRPGARLDFTAYPPGLAARSGQGVGGGHRRPGRRRRQLVAPGRTPSPCSRRCWPPARAAATTRPGSGRGRHRAVLGPGALARFPVRAASPAAPGQGGTWSRSAP